MSNQGLVSPMRRKRSRSAWPEARKLEIVPERGRIYLIRSVVVRTPALRKTQIVFPIRSLGSFKFESAGVEPVDGSHRSLRLRRVLPLKRPGSKARGRGPAG